MDTGTRFLIMNKAVYISQSTNTLGKVWIQQFSLQLLGRLSSLTLVWQLILKKENSELKPVKLNLKYRCFITSCLCGGVIYFTLCKNEFRDLGIGRCESYLLLFCFFPWIFVQLLILLGLFCIFFQLDLC